MERSKYKKARQNIRHNRVRAKISGTAERPRLSVFRSNRSLYVQLIDDEAQKTLAAFDSRKAEGKTLSEKAKVVGEGIAEKAKALGVSKVTFDRGGHRYQGTLAILADAARGKGLEF